MSQPPDPPSHSARTVSADLMLRMAAKISQLGAWVLDARTLAVTWSEELRAILEVPPDYQPTVADAIGFYAPESRPAVAAAVQRALATGEGFDLEQQLITRTGRRIWVRGVGEAVRDEAGRLVQVQGALQDISAFKALAQENQKLTTRLEDILEAMSDGFLTIDRAGCLTYINARGEQLLDCVRRDVLGRPAGDLLPDSGRFAEPMQRALVHGEPVQFEAFCEPHALWLQVRVHPSEAGLAVYFHDITESKTAAERIRRDAERLRNTFNSLTDGFGTIDRAWRVTFANPAGAAVLQKTREELLGGNIWTLFPGLELTPFGDFYRRAMEERVPQELEDFYPPLQVWLRARCFPTDEGVAVSFTDITEARRAQQEVLRLNAELEERVRQRTVQLETAYRDLESFSYMLAHDLRAPIAAVEAFSGFVQESPEQQLGPRSRHYLGRVRSAAQRMNATTEAILALAHLSYVPLAQQPVDLTAAAEDLLRTLAEGEPHRQVHWHVAPGLAAQGDPALLQVVLQNLLTNAWKYTATGDPGCIEMGEEVHEGRRCFFVRDNGVGFDPERAENLFQPFQRLHGDQFVGIGVGLASVRRIVARHGGDVWARAQPGLGATFYFNLCAR